ncbi:MAG: DUF222 domain-containing protein, partial [Streptosporangiales bacterium]|nr:DUF222 domain-containing protein [Streptosporangiales bacterium]
MDDRGQALLAGLADMPPGPELVSVLAGLDKSRLPVLAVMEVMRAERRLASHFLAASMDSMVEIGTRADVPEGDPEHIERIERLAMPGEFASDEIAAALTLTRRTADAEFWTAWDLHERLPDVMAAFRLGAIDWPRARIFSEVLTELSDAQAVLIATRVLPKAPTMTTGQLAARLKREAMAIDPEWYARRYRERVKERRVIKTVNGDGSANLGGYDLPFDEACQAMANIDTLAERAKHAGDPRPLDTIRADIFTGYLTGTYQHLNDEDILTDLLHRPDPTPPTPDNPHPTPTPSPATPSPPGPRAPGPRSQEPRPPGSRPPGPRAPGLRPPEPPAPGTRPPGPRPEPRAPGARLPGPRPRPGYEIRVKVSTLLGLDEHPAEVPGTGPVHAELARKIVADQTRGQWRYAITDDAGRLLDEGITRARPTGALRDAANTTGAIVELAIPERLLTHLAAHPDRAGTWTPVITDLHRQTHPHSTEGARHPADARHPA